MSEPTPHEPAAVLRLNRAGISFPRIAGLLKMSKQQLIHETNTAIDDELEAYADGRPIHDPDWGQAVNAKVTEKNARDVVIGDVLVSHGFAVAAIYKGAGLVTFELSTGERVNHAPFDKVEVT